MPELHSPIGSFSPNPCNVLRNPATVLHVIPKFQSRKKRRPVVNLHDCANASEEDDSRDYGEDDKRRIYLELLYNQGEN